MEIPQSVLMNGKRYLEERRPIMLAISINNPHYYKQDVMQRLLCFAGSNSDKVLLFIPDKISEHNYRALGSRKSQTAARKNGNYLRNKWKEMIDKSGIGRITYKFVSWIEEVEICPKYTEALQYVENLYQANSELRADIHEITSEALQRLKDRCERNGSKTEIEKGERRIDLEEGVQYVLKELAFFASVPSIYDGCSEWVLVYHRYWSLLEKFFGGYYDGVARPSFGFFVLE